jgi:hypothetical protein
VKQVMVDANVGRSIFLNYWRAKELKNKFDSFEISHVKRYFPFQFFFYNACITQHMLCATNFSSIMTFQIWRFDQETRLKILVCYGNTRLQYLLQPRFGDFLKNQLIICSWWNQDFEGYVLGFRIGYLK